MAVMHQFDKEHEIKFEFYNALSDVGFVINIWNNLLKRAEHSYFNSLGWIQNWITSLPPNQDVKLVVGFVEDEPVVAFFVGRRKKNKYGLLPSKTLSLNSTSDSYYDQLYIEYNSILVDTRVSLSLQELLDCLNLLGWNEFSLPGVSSKFVSAFGLLENHSNKRIHIVVDEESSAFFVDLEEVRRAEMDYFKLLSSNKRSQIRRSIKQYELDGDVRIKESEDLNEALSMFENLVSLHQQEWMKRGMPGAFSNKYLLQFHRNLIQNRFEHNEIQLLHIYNEKMTIGYLYNFVYDRNILFYQSGFNYLAENTYRPGLVSHYFAIMHNAKRGMSKYDFLAGDSSYKSSLSTNSSQIYWIRLVKGEGRYFFERSLLSLKDKIKSMPKVLQYLKKLKYWVTSFRG